MRFIVVFITVITIFAAACSPAAQAQNVSHFSDIRGHWAEQTISDLMKRGILDGYPNGTFRPNEPVKVDQFIKMLLLSYTQLHQNGERSWTTSFIQSLTPENQTILKQDYRYFDFKPGTVGYWAKPYIDLASDLNFINKNRFPDYQKEMTRENVAEILYYTLKETEFLEDEQFTIKVAEQFGDLRSAAEREQRFIAEILVKGLMQGYPNGSFGVGRTVTRAESLTILERLTDKTKRISIDADVDTLYRNVPVSGGGTKAVVFPDKQMWDAYEVLEKAGLLRGANYDLFGTTLRLYKDGTERDNVALGLSGQTEEAALWLEPAYNTYGITIRLREGSLARNSESIELFANYLFDVNAYAFHQKFSDICARLEKGEPVESETFTIGTYAVDLRVNATDKTAVFSIAKKR
ncbi:S-layer homology domain-containing protein [Paenibacillus tarimensis]